MDNVFTKKDPLVDVINQVVLGEKKLTPAELKKREEIAQAMERENPGMDMGKKMAIATAQAKKVAEEVEELDEGVVRTAKHIMGIMSKGEPDHKTAPKWATHIGRTHEGAYHWLDKHSEVEKDNSDKYFPSAGRTKFTGHKDEQQGKGFVKKLSHVKEEVEQIDEADKTSLIGKMKRRNEADKKSVGEFVRALRSIDPETSEKAIRNSNRYWNLANRKNKTSGGFPKSTTEEFILDEQLENFWGAYLTCLDEAKDDASQQALLLRAMAKDPSDLMKMKRAIAMGDKALTNPVMRQEILKMLDQMMNLTVTDKSLLQKTRSSFMKQKQFKAVDTTNTEEYVPEEVEELDEAKIPVHHVNKAVTKVLGTAGAARFATHLRSGTDKHTSWDKVNSALMKQGVKTKHIADVAAHLKPAQYNEEAEQIDELSKGTLGSYVKAASGGINGMAALAHMAGSVTDADQKKMYWKKAVKRGKGIATAADKLTKEEVEQVEETKEQPPFEGGREVKSSKPAAERVKKIAKGMLKKYAKEDFVEEFDLDEAIQGMTTKQHAEKTRQLKAEIEKHEQARIDAQHRHSAAKDALEAHRKLDPKYVARQTAKKEKEDNSWAGYREAGRSSETRNGNW